MPVFEFDDENGSALARSTSFGFLNTGINPTAGTASVSGTDEGVSFTLTTSTLNLFQLIYSPTTAPGGDGYFAITEQIEVPEEPFVATLTWTDGLGNTMLTGNVSARFEVNGDNLYQISFISTAGTQVTTLPGHPTAQTVNLTGNFTAIRFTLSNAPGGAVIPADSIFLEMLSGNLACFCAGTAIATACGPRAVETLQPGDVLRTADGGSTTVQWLGRQEVPANLLHPRKTNPIRIAAGAIAPQVPDRDLYLSPDHAIAIDGVLCQVGALVNGTTITQPDRTPAPFTYYHVETEAHQLILAENCPAESYLDMPGRESFTNGAERADAPLIAEMDLPRITSARLVPSAVLARLTPRAA